MAIKEINQQCEHGKNGMHRLCDNPIPVTTLNSFKAYERPTDKGDRGLLRREDLLDTPNLRRMRRRAGYRNTAKESQLPETNKGIHRCRVRQNVGLRAMNSLQYYLC
jgi:hypothetical protein